MLNSNRTNFTHGATRLVLLLLLAGAQSVAEISRLSCSVTAFPGGRVQYHLSPTVPQNCTEQGWEDANETALTFGSRVDEARVEKVSDQELVLKTCLCLVRFRAQCHTFVEATCSVNCSSISDHLLKPSAPPGRPSTENSSGQSDPRVVIISVLVLLTGGVVLVGVLWLLLLKFRRWRQGFIQGRSSAEAAEAWS